MRSHIIWDRQFWDRDQKQMFLPHSGSLLVDDHQRRKRWMYLNNCRITEPQMWCDSEQGKKCDPQMYEVRYSWCSWEQILMSLYKAKAKPPLDRSVPFQALRLKKERFRLEQVQRGLQEYLREWRACLMKGWQKKLHYFNLLKVMLWGDMMAL